MEKEIRYYELQNIELRKSDDGVEYFEGLAAVYNKESEDLGGFREIILPGFFDSMDMTDTRALFNHNQNYILGRSKSGTLQLDITTDGLAYKIKKGNRSYDNDLKESIERGDVSQSSFGFTIEKDKWEKKGDQVYRYLILGKRLYDVSPVTFPAYPDTTAAKRSMQEYLEETEKPVEFKENQYISNQVTIKSL